MDILKEAVKRIRKIDPQKIVLFGSYAYGNPTSESDIDLFIVKDLEGKSKRDWEVEAKLQLVDLIMETHLAFDIFVDSAESVLQRLKEDSFYKEIFTKGKILYAK